MPGCGRAPLSLATPQDGSTPLESKRISVVAVALVVDGAAELDQVIAGTINHNEARCLRQFGFATGYFMQVFAAVQLCRKLLGVHVNSPRR